MLQKISGHSVRVVAGTVALFVAHKNPLEPISSKSIAILARIVNVSGKKDIRRIIALCMQKKCGSALNKNGAALTVADY